MEFQAFIYEHEESVIKRWLAKVELEFPGMYNLQDLYRNGTKYMRLIADFHIPLEYHPLYDIIPTMCRYHAERGTPVEHVLHSSHIWRESLLEMIGTYYKENRLFPKDILELTSILHKRIDEVQRMISKLYWDYTQEVIKQKQQKIDELHNDRLSLLGKMAASMAHEIKNPLFAIEGFLKLIKNDLTCSPSGSYSKIHEYIEVVEKEFEGLYRQITSFLSFSKNSGTEEPFVECKMSEIMKQVYGLIQPRAVNEKVDLVRIIEADPKIVVQKVAIQQVISNLLNNSIDALSSIHHPKKIIIRSWEDDKHFYFSVIDNGPGIPENLKSTIFEPFVTSKKNGTGLGLAICKQIMEKNRGSLSFTSQKGETVFHLSLLKDCGLVAS